MRCQPCEALRAYRREGWVSFETYRDDAARAHGNLRELSEEGLPGSGFVKRFACATCARRWRLTVMFDHGTEEMVGITQASELAIEIRQGDITREDVDAIVNAANAALCGGGGVDAAGIHRAAGPALLTACRQLGACPTGQARITPGFALPARHVIHAVGPVWQGGDAGEDALLASCYRAVFDLAATHGLRSLAFPAISSGAYRFPLERATRIAYQETVQEQARARDLARVHFVCFDAQTHAVYRRVFAR